MTLPQEVDAAPAVEAVTWKKAHASSGASNCVELARYQGSILVRDSKNPRGGKLTFPRAAVEAFLGNVGR